MDYRDNPKLPPIQGVTVGRRSGVKIPRRLTLADPSKAWRRAKELAGLDKDLRIHDLRHTFASTLVGKGRSLHEVGTLLGHSQLSMTMRYAHLAPARLIEAANEALPVAP